MIKMQCRADGREDNIVRIEDAYGHVTEVT
jgi:hypothetical protein